MNFINQLCQLIVAAIVALGMTYGALIYYTMDCTYASSGDLTFHQVTCSRK